jgi:hypothetical protein
LPQLKLGLLATAVKQARPDLMAIEQCGDAPQVDAAGSGKERFGEAANDVKFVVSKAQHMGAPGLAYQSVARDDRAAGFLPVFSSG